MGVWTADISDNVYMRITNDFSEDLKKKYKIEKTEVTFPSTGVTQVTWSNFSTSQVSETSNLKFPYMTIIELPGAERGQDLEGTSINAALFTFQADVFCNGYIAGEHPETVVKKCMSEITRIMKTMRFSVNAMPSFDSKPQEYRMTARFSRILGFNETL